MVLERKGGMLSGSLWCVPVSNICGKARLFCEILLNFHITVKGWASALVPDFLLIPQKAMDSQGALSETSGLAEPWLQRLH